MGVHSGTRAEGWPSWCAEGLEAFEGHQTFERARMAKIPPASPGTGKRLGFIAKLSRSVFGGPGKSEETLSSGSGGGSQWFGHPVLRSA